MTRLWLPRRLYHLVRRPIRVDLEGGLGNDHRRLSFDESLKLGYGEDCEVRLDGESGPEVVCSLSRADGPYRLWTSPDIDRSEQGLEILIDGTSAQSQFQDLRPGTRVEIFDRPSGRRYRLRVDPPSSWRPRYLALVVLALALAGSVYGLYFYFTITGTQTQIQATASRLRRAEADVQQARASLEMIEARMTAAQGEFANALGELRRAQSLSERAIRTEFDLRIAALTEHSQQELARISERDSEARERLRAEARAQVAALHQELEERMVGAYQEFKRVEQRLIRTLGSHLEAMAPAGEHFKGILRHVRGSIVFIRTRYPVEFARTGETAIQQGFGSGFLTNSRGLAVTARHVLFPWLYDQKLQVLIALGLARVREDAVTWNVWIHEQTVVAGKDDAGDPKFNTADSWNSDGGARTLDHLYSPPLKFTQSRVEAPVGVVSIRLPETGDVAVLQLLPFASPETGLTLAVREAEALDETLAVGYPFSRLEDGHAVAQGVTGFVRRLTTGELELNTAFNPGLSGGPILDRDARVIGMAIGILQSDVYGIALRARDLRQALDSAVARVRAEELRLQARGCDPGPVDGVFDEQTRKAYDCVRAAAPRKSVPAQ